MIDLKEAWQRVQDAEEKMKEKVKEIQNLNQNEKPNKD